MTQNEDEQKEKTKAKPDMKDWDDPKISTIRMEFIEKVDKKQSSGICAEFEKKSVKK